MSRTTRRRRPPQLLRARFRTLFFAACAAAAIIAGVPAAAVAALVGVGLGLASVRVAQAHGSSLTYTFVVGDWLVLGLCLATSGGMQSWFLVAIPALTLGELSGSERPEWPFLVAPSLATAILLACVDPSLGGHRGLGLLTLFLLVGGGVAAASRLRRPARRPQRRRAALVTVDSTTGFYAAGRLEPLLGGRLGEAAAHQEALSVVCLRLEHYDDTAAFHGPESTEAIVRTVARRVQRLLGPDDLAFRLADDTFLVALPGRTLREARAVAALMRHELTSQLVGHHKLAVSAGAATFPTVPTVAELVAEAQHAMSPVPLVAAAAS